MKRKSPIIEYWILHWLNSLDDFLTVKSEALMISHLKPNVIKTATILNEQIHREVSFMQIQLKKNFIVKA